MEQDGKLVPHPKDMKDKHSTQNVVLSVSLDQPTKDSQYVLKIPANSIATVFYQHINVPDNITTMISHQLPNTSGLKRIVTGQKNNRC